MSSSDAPKVDFSSSFELSNIKTVTSRDGTSIHVEGRGNHFGPHIIFAPGFATTLAVFDPLFDDLSLNTQLYMVRYDPRGQGLSGQPETAEYYTSDRYADDLKAIIEKFQLKKPFFAGWSIGATIATDIAANFPHPLPFSGVISLARSVYFDLEDIARMATPYAMSLFAGLQDNTDTTAGFQTRFDFVDAFSAAPDVPFATKLAWLGGSALSPPTIAALVGRRTQDTTGLKEAAKAGWPLLSIIGAEDKITVGDFLRELALTMFTDHEVHTIPDCGHMVFYDKEETVAEYILSFVHRVVQTKSYP